MENKYGIVGIAHVGLPTNDLQKTVEFYKSLGFEEIMQTYNEKAGEKVAFLQIKNYCIETFENGKAEMSDGAVNHKLNIDTRDNQPVRLLKISDDNGKISVYLAGTYENVEEYTQTVVDNTLIDIVDTNGKSLSDEDLIKELF
mgnify:CR=1 FL=1